MLDERIFMIGQMGEYSGQEKGEDSTGRITSNCVADISRQYRENVSIRFFMYRTLRQRISFGAQIMSIKTITVSRYLPVYIDMDERTRPSLYRGT